MEKLIMVLMEEYFIPIMNHGCQMVIARFLDHMCLALGASGLWLRYAMCVPTPSTLAQSKERKGSNFAIWQHCHECVPSPQSAIPPSNPPMLNAGSEKWYLREGPFVHSSSASGHLNSILGK